MLILGPGNCIERPDTTKAQLNKLKTVSRIVRVIIFSGLLLLYSHPQMLKGQVVQGQGEKVLSSFVKPEIHQKAGELSFNVVRIHNPADTTIKIKPVINVPTGWAIFSASFVDTIISPGDTISLSFRIRIPANASSEIRHQIFFRAYTMENKLLNESSFFVFPEVFHNWDVQLKDKRKFFYPHQKEIRFEMDVLNQGNTPERISIEMEPDNRIELQSLGDWEPGQDVYLEPFEDTTLNFAVRYNLSEDRIFDISKIRITAIGGDKKIYRTLLVEKYSDAYSPFYIDKGLPHQVELGFRTFSKNNDFLPFIKARGSAYFNNGGNLRYNFNYYNLTESEDIISNTYYNFVYQQNSFKAALGAFSSPLGRNLYSRHAVAISNEFKIGRYFSLEGFASQSFLSPKTSAALGYAIRNPNLNLHGSFAYDIDRDRKVNTASVLFQSSPISLNEKNRLSFNLYGYHENHYRNTVYTLMGIAWDINYVSLIGEKLAVQVINNYGSPRIPGPQMGLLNFSLKLRLATNVRKRYFTSQYNNSSRDYFDHDIQGLKLPNSYLKNQYLNVLYHSHENPENTWSAGPSFETYYGRRPILTEQGGFSEYRAQKIRFEYKAVLLRNLMLNLKTGISDISYTGETSFEEVRYDFHLFGGYAYNGYGIMFGYDYGPMVNTGLYQYAGDALNHSFNFGPQIVKSYFNNRLAVTLFANYLRRFDLGYSSVNVNPRLEMFLFRNWYGLLSGTYSYTRQNYTEEIVLTSSHVYLEVAIKKRWGKSQNKQWEKELRRLKVVLFKDDNGNGEKDDGEEGVPYVKTRLKLVNTDMERVKLEFPVDITLLSNEEGIVYYNRVPVGFYELSITPLGDVQEYFYVDKTLENIELTKNRTYEVPFQKANKITGKVNLKRTKFIKEGQEDIDLGNIKVTAFNRQGNSYSSFTSGDGSFVIYVPEDNTYLVRIKNIFGSSFRILQNDIRIVVNDTSINRVEFNVVESTRKVNFRTAEPATPDTVAPAPQKIRVLPGKVYENPVQEGVDKDAIPMFRMQATPPEAQPMLPGKFYVVIGEPVAKEVAEEYWRVLRENGVEAFLGFDSRTKSYHVYTGYFDDRGEARQHLALLKAGGLNVGYVLEYE